MPTVKNVKRSLYMGANFEASSIVLKSGADSWVFDPSFDQDKTEKTYSITIKLKEQPEPEPEPEPDLSSHSPPGFISYGAPGESGGQNLPPVWGLISAQVLSDQKDSADTEAYMVKLLSPKERINASNDTNNITTWKITMVDSSETEKKYAIKVNGHTEWMLGAASDDEKTTMVVLRKASEDDTRFHWHIK